MNSEEQFVKMTDHLLIHFIRSTALPEFYCRVIAYLESIDDDRYDTMSVRKASSRSTLSLTSCFDSDTVALTNLDYPKFSDVMEPFSDPAFERILMCLRDIVRQYSEFAIKERRYAKNEFYDQDWESIGITTSTMETDVAEVSFDDSTYETEKEKESVSWKESMKTLFRRRDKGILLSNRNQEYFNTWSRHGGLFLDILTSFLGHSSSGEFRDCCSYWIAALARCALSNQKATIIKRANELKWTTEVKFTCCFTDSDVLVARSFVCNKAVMSSSAFMRLLFLSTETYKSVS